MAKGLADRHLLWIDLEGRSTAGLDTVAEAVGIDRKLVELLATERKRADLTQYEDHIHLVLQAMEPPAEGDKEGQDPVRHALDIVAGRNWVVTVHDEPLRALERLDSLTEGETRLGGLDAAGFLAGIGDEVLADYFDLAEAIERDIDRLDELALRRRPDEDFLAHIVELRRRIGIVRRTLAPHRVAFAALGRPEMELHEELGRPWPGLSDRLERAIDAVENLRDLLLGSFDIHMGRAAQDANNVMKVLTLLSAVLLPSVVLAGAMGMNFKVSFFEDPTNFWIVIAAMVAFGVSMVVVARWRHWI